MFLWSTAPVLFFILGTFPVLSWDDTSDKCRTALITSLPSTSQERLLDLATFRAQTLNGMVASLPPIKKVEILGKRSGQEVWRISFHNGTNGPIILKVFTPTSEKLQYPNGPYSPAPEIVEAEFHRKIKLILDYPTEMDKVTSNHFSPLIPLGIQLRQHSITFQNISGENLHRLLQDKTLPLPQRQLLAQTYNQRVKNLLRKISEVLSASSTFPSNIHEGPAEQYLSKLGPVGETYPDIPDAWQIIRPIIEFTFRGQFFSIVLTPENILVSLNNEKLEMYLVNLSL